MVVFIKHIDIEGPGTLGEFFNNQTSWQTKIVELENGEILPSLDDCEAIISLGGPMNVYEEDKYPFLQEEDKLLKKAIKEEIPILGICLGAQILAKACGAKVKKAPRKEIGWYKVNLTEAAKQDMLFKSLPSQLEVFQWHQDTFEIPKGAQLIAESNTCTNQAFRFGRNAYGLQFHIEVTPQMVELWINKYTKKESQEFDPKDMLIESYKRKESFKRQADLIYFNFAKIIAKSSRVDVS